MLVLGLDVGGSSIKSGLVDSQGSLSELARTPTPQDDPHALRLIEVLSELVEGYKSKAKLEAVGLSVPGITDSDQGIAVFSGTLGWRNLPLQKMLSDEIGLPVFLVHDVTAGGIAELKIGAASGLDSAAVIAIGTGLAVSLVLDSKIYHPHASVGELGHVPTRNQRPCVCGKIGCLEMTCSGGALSRNYKGITGKDLPAHEVVELALAQEAAAKELWDEFLDELGFACHHISSLLGPDAIVIAGGFGYLGDKIVKPLQEYLENAMAIQKIPRVVVSKLDGTSGCIGAALNAHEKISAN